MPACETLIAIEGKLQTSEYTVLTPVNTVPTIKDTSIESQCTLVWSLFP